jgi:hypothetical protein
VKSNLSTFCRPFTFVTLFVVRCRKVFITANNLRENFTVFARHSSPIYDKFIARLASDERRAHKKSSRGLKSRLPVRQNQFKALWMPKTRATQGVNTPSRPLNRKALRIITVIRRPDEDSTLSLCYHSSIQNMANQINKSFRPTRSPSTSTSIQAADVRPGEAWIITMNLSPLMKLALLSLRNRNISPRRARAEREPRCD